MTALRLDPGPGPLVPLVLAFGVAALVTAGGRPVKADELVLGYRTELTAFLKGKCRTVAIPPERLANQFPCSTHAENLRDLATNTRPDRLGLPPGNWEFRARCVWVKGQAPV